MISLSNIGYATLSVMPSARGFGPALSNEVNPQMRGTGLSAGKILGTGLLAGFVAISAGIGAVLKTGFDEAKDASAGSAQLAAGIKSTGNAANVSLDSMNALASSIQGYSGQTDDSIVAAQSLLLTFTKIKNTDTDKIFDRATTATANMAAKMGGDASGSAIQLGKALHDPIKGVASLGRMGVQFSADQKAMIKSLVDTGDVAGAQNVILAELETQFGGAAEAAGNSLPGQLAKAKRSFEDVSQAVVEGLLPVVLPGLTSIGTTITDKVIPAVTGFIQGFKDGEGPGGRFRDVLTAIHEQGVKPIADFITGTAVPAVQRFVDEFRDGEGTGGTFRDILTDIRDNAIVPLSDFITGTALPALVSISDWITEDAGPALSDFKGWVADNKAALEVFGTFITVILLPIFLDMAAKAAASALTQVGAWVSTQVAGVTSAASQFASHYVAVAGWVASAAAAVSSGAVTVAIWAMIKWDAIVGAAASVAAMVTMDIQWGISALASVGASIAMAASWIKVQIQSVISAAISIGSHLAVGAGWIGAAAIATASGIVMAAAWVIGLGPIAWVIAGVLAVGAVFVVLYQKVGWFRDAVDGVWAWIKRAWSGLADWFDNIDLSAAGKAIIDGFLKGIKAKFEDVKDFVGGIGKWISDNKGPISYDRALLIPAGNAIMDGLNKGLDAGFRKVKSNISGMNGEMAGLITVPTVASPDFSSGAYSGAANGRSGAGITQNVYPTPGLSEQQIGDAAARQLAWAMRG